MNNMQKGAGYYLLRSIVLIDMGIVAILAILMSASLQMDAVWAKGEDYMILMLYVTLLGTALVPASSMITALLAKDKLSRRIEFFVASGSSVKEILLKYSIQIFRLSGTIPFLLFLGCYCFHDWTVGFHKIVSVYLSVLLLSFCEILALNLIVLDVKRMKLFKNMLFFGNFAVIYFIAMSAEDITKLLRLHKIAVELLLIAFNLALSIGLSAFCFLKIRKISNENVIGRDGQWI